MIPMVKKKVKMDEKSCARREEVERLVDGERVSRWEKMGKVKYIVWGNENGGGREGVDVDEKKKTW